LQKSFPKGIHFGNITEVTFILLELTFCAVL